MAHETPLCILVRRLALQHPELYAKLFNDASKLPTLAQYDPTMFYFEAEDGNLLCSSYSGLPLYRYDLKDHGGVLSLKDIKSLFSEVGIDLTSEIESAGIANTVWNLPFVYVFERSDFSVSFFAFQVYPETVRKALLTGALPSSVTGKCTMEVSYDSAGAQQFAVHIELCSGIEPTDELNGDLVDAITNKLLNENSEYQKTSEEYGVDRVKPIVTLWPYEDMTYFKPGGKQKWVKK